MKRGMWLIPLVMGVSLALCGVVGGQTAATGKGYAEGSSFALSAPERGELQGYQRFIVLLGCGAAGMICMGGWRDSDDDDGGLPGSDQDRGGEG